MFKRLFRRKEKEAPGPEEQARRESSIDRGIYYLYMIVGAQILFVMGLVVVIMLIGKVIATPWWIFLFSFALLVGGIIYIWRKAKKQFRKFRESFGQFDLSTGNYEISIMGGVVTMRVEHNQQKLLGSPPPASPTIMDAEPLEVSPPGPKPVHHPS